MANFFKEFKTFITRGNVIDLSVGIIMGAAFTAIVNSLVNDIIMPMVGYAIGGVDFKQLKIVLKPAIDAAPEVAVLYGAFIQQFINFVIIAFVVFLMIRFINKYRKKEEVKEMAINEDIVLLTEIRDLLKKDKEA